MNPKPHIMCAVGDIHRSETAPLDRVPSSFLTKGQGANEPCVPKILTATGTIDVILEEEVRRRCDNFNSGWPEIWFKFWRTRVSVEAPSLPTGVLTVKFENLKYLHLLCGDGVLQVTVAYVMMAKTRDREKINFIIIKEIEKI